jgi:hypothetical protein
LKFKDLVCRVGLGDWLIEYCDDCGRTQPLVWWCDDPELWLRVKGETGGVLCPECFNQRASLYGIPLRWYPEYDWAAGTVAPGGPAPAAGGPQTMTKNMK